MNQPRRTHAQARAEMRDGILRLGREQLATRSAADLSVREIARGLGVASSAVYRHVKNRDELVTLLVIDAYNDLAEAATPMSRTDSADITEPSALLSSLAHHIRSWAVANPTRWALIYGTPIPGYAAPAEETTPPGTRVMAALLEILAHGTVGDPTPPPSPGLAAKLQASAAELGMPGMSPQFLAAGVDVWMSLIGTISAEVFDQLGTDLSTCGPELLNRWVTSTVHRFSLG
ncbi:TetR/AcrR family transcriptional regulator [Corynebacterium glyciniphilum]|uniref:TetR/AcrR family transcriptional regulator n=1 Tax=Corynebacterium glyciniphilum TaxID=1404244 RepID=UPI0011AB75CC|nr:TetR/AcrR family transcriptional regulator [Corynebacterium glyciniphilum]